MNEYSQGNVELDNLLNEYYKHFNDNAYSDVEWNFDKFEVDEFIYYIKKCLETDTEMHDYLEEHFGDYNRLKQQALPDVKCPKSIHQKILESIFNPIAKIIKKLFSK